MLDDRPDFAPTARRVIDAVRTSASKAGADPLAIARTAKVDEVSALAALALLLRAGLGSFVVQIADSAGRVVAEYPSVEAVPREVEDDFGDRIEVEPSNMRVVFRADFA